MDATQLQRALASTAKVSAIARSTMFAPEAARGGNDNTLWTTMGSCIRVLTHTYAMSDKPLPLCELEIRDVWYLFVLAAQHIDAHHPAQDRLTRLILWARELGVLTRTRKRSLVGQHLTIAGEEEQEVERGDGGKVASAAAADDDAKVGAAHDEEGDDDDLVAQDAITSDGRIWVDLPFLVQDVQAAWKAAMIPSALADQRCNLAAAIARLAGLGILDEAFSGCGLDIMRTALETTTTPPPQTTSAGVTVDESCPIAQPAEAPLTIVQLLPLVKIWLQYAGDKMLRLSLAGGGQSRGESEWNTSGGASSLGQLARNAGVDFPGFSQARYLFWKDRLLSLKKTEDESVKKVATECSDMINAIWNSYFGVR